MSVLARQSNFPTRALAVTPSDVTTFDDPSTIFVGALGTVRVTPWNQDTQVDFIMPAGAVVPVLVSQVFSTGTTATDLVRVFHKD